ncbi:MAG TPA: LytTR family DNA-binding domain-containing protein [Flavobacterium sp.]|jgi:DNA-binding LytR/AlgR family response regulator|nr:LytTR family DNA-binding domain-containing protein [Flavobacterium sp.]
MTTIIIEDEKPAARLLQRKLEKIGVSTDVMLNSVEEAVAWFLENKHPDLIFLDIQLSDGLSFEIFEQVEIKSAVIFTTAYDEYALKAFKLNSVDYLLKPIDEDDLETAVTKFKARSGSNSSQQIDLDQIKRLLQSPDEKSYRKRFTLKVGQHLKVINIEEIECFYSENKGTYIHTVENRDYLIESTLEVLENELDPAVFFRVSRKFIVPMKAVREIVMYSNSRLKIMLPTYKADEVIVSREKVADFKKWIG